MTLDSPAIAPPRASWLGLLGFALLLALLGVALVQARQFSLLRSALGPSDDLGAVAVVQTEAQLLRLQSQLLDGLRHLPNTPYTPSPPAAAEAQAPLAPALHSARLLWRERLTALRDGPARELLATEPRYSPLLAQLEVFSVELDEGLGSDADHRLALLSKAERSAARLQPALQSLSQEAVQRLSLQLDRRAQLVRTQTRLGLALTAFLTVLTLAFAAISLRQVRSLRERRIALEELAESLGQARREAEAASQAKSAFLANMSHEIRTPFHGLMGMLSLLREAGLTPRQIDHLRTATESAEHLLALLNDILDMSQLESGRLTLAPSAVTLRTLLREVEALMRPQAALKALALHIDADPGVPERVMLDGTRVRQIVFNLLSNAIKFSERGAVVLDVRCGRPMPGSARRQMLEFMVTDTGPGMDEATQARLFSRFMQGDSSRQRRHGGSGLGLEISRNLARLMEGDITVRSRPGEGSCFTFWMPLRVVEAPSGTEASLPAPGPTAARALRVLVAEDHPVNRQYLAAVLETQGHDAHFAADGQEALQAAQRQRFDVVLMDLHMPVLDGIEATRAIRALPDTTRAAVPIVALTADAYPETQDRCMVAGMNDFLTKPVSPQGLATCLRRLFGQLGATATHAVDEQATPARAATGTEPNALLDTTAMAMALQAMSATALQDLIESYLAQGPETVQRLRAAVRGAQPLDLRVHAHAAKGAALNLGLTGLAATAQALQGGAAHLPAHEIARLVQRFEDQLLATRAELPQALRKARAEAAETAAETAAEAATGDGTVTR